MNDDFNKNDDKRVNDFFRKLSEQSNLEGARGQKESQPQYHESEQRREPTPPVEDLDVVFYPSSTFRDGTTREVRKPAQSNLPPIQQNNPQPMQSQPVQQYAQRSAFGYQQEGVAAAQYSNVSGQPIAKRQPDAADKQAEGRDLKSRTTPDAGETKGKGSRLSRFGKGNKDSGKNGAGKNGQKKKKSDAPVWKRLLKVALYVVCAMAVVLCVAAVYIAVYLSKETVNDETILDLNSIKLSYATLLMAEDKDNPGEWVEYERIYNDENRIWVNYEDMPQVLLDCIVASEDKDFWNHKGVDIKRTAGAMLDLVFEQIGLPDLIYKGTQGGSTITQQLIKNITDEDETTVMRKVREIYRAYQLEKRFTKEQILEAYLNTFRLGGQIAGIEAGANYYCNTTTEALTAAQCAAIVCITKAPGANDPFVNPEENKYQRDNVVLWLMNQQGYLDSAEYAAAMAESEAMTFDHPGGTHRPGATYTWFTDTAVNEVIQDLKDYGGYSLEDATRLFYQGGLRVYLTVDTHIQDVCDDIAVNGYIINDDGTREFAREAWEKDEDGNYVLDENGERVLLPPKDQPQAAYVVMDFEGNIKGLAGALYKKQGSLVQNIAVDSVRQTGSSMKPIGAYCLPLEYNYITYSTGLIDTPFQGSWPVNFDHQYTRGPVPVVEAIKKSLNTIAVKALAKIGPETSYDFLTSVLGITSLVEEDKASYSAIALGGMTWGISPLQMCAAYAIFGNGGTYYEPHSYSRIEDARGEVILDKADRMAVNKAISEDTSFIMNKILQQVVAGGTCVNASPNRIGLNPNGLPYAAKSGTASDNTDFWCIGMNPYYVCAVWEGYLETEKGNYLRQLSPHPTQRIFRLLMGEISKDLEYKNFPEAENVKSATFCKASGNLASPACPEVETGWYKTGTEPPMCQHEWDTLPVEEDPAAA